MYEKNEPLIWTWKSLYFDISSLDQPSSLEEGIRIRKEKVSRACQRIHIRNEKNHSFFLRNRYQIKE